MPQAVWYFKDYIVNDNYYDCIQEDQGKVVDYVHKLKPILRNPKIAQAHDTFSEFHLVWFQSLTKAAFFFFFLFFSITSMVFQLFLLP